MSVVDLRRRLERIEASRRTGAPSRILSDQPSDFPRRTKGENGTAEPSLRSQFEFVTRPARTPLELAVDDLAIAKSVGLVRPGWKKGTGTPVADREMQLAERFVTAGAVRRTRMALAFDDLLSGLLHWRIWWLLGANDIRVRYRRSTFGQLWLTFSMAIMIVGLGVLYSYLFNMELKEYLPLIAVSLIVWNFVAGIVNDGGMVFISAQGYMTNVALPVSTFVYRVIVRNLIILAHNAILLPILFLLFGASLNLNTLLSVVGLTLISLNGVWIGLLLGILCARYRDLPAIVANLMQLAFFFSPVLWKPAQLSEHVKAIYLANPFTYLIGVMREPLLGHPIHLIDIVVVLAIAAIGFAVTIPLFARTRARIVFWL